MPKLIDQVGVAELVAKREAAAVASYVKGAVARVKALTGSHVDSHVEAGNKPGVAAVKAHGKDVVAALKSTDA